MFKILENSGFPIRFPLKPGVSLFAGSVVSLNNYKNNIVVDLCDGKKFPIGIVGKRYRKINCFDFNNIVEVNINRMVLRLTRFEDKNIVNVGDDLYCNKNGKLTNNKIYKSSVLLGKLIEKNNKYSTIFWL
jgi:hypothetical protein